MKEIDHGFLKVAKEVDIGEDLDFSRITKNLDDNDNVIDDRKTFIQKLLNYFNRDLILFTNQGYLSWIVFKDHAMVIVKDAKDKDLVLGCLAYHCN